MEVGRWGYGEKVEAGRGGGADADGEFRVELERFTFAGVLDLLLLLLVAFK